VRRGVCLAVLIAAGAGTAGAQAPPPALRPVDRIVAVVGTTPILASQVEEQLVAMQANGQPLPTDSAARTALRKQILDQMVQDEVLVQQAQKDTNVKVTDQEVNDAVQTQVQNVRRQYHTDAEFQAQLRLAQFSSEDDWRRYLADQQRRSILEQRLLEMLRDKGKLRPIQPTEAQMREYWEENKNAQQKRPPLVSFRQLIMTPKPDSAAVATARKTADSLLVALKGGADFAGVARRFSDDSSTREAGGELGWFRRGVMYKTFEDAAFSLRPGEMSGVVRTPYGFHIIQVERVEPAEILARHVLIAPVVSAAQVEATRRLADSLRTALQAGAPFDSIAATYGDPDAQKIAEDVPVTQLPPDYQRPLADSTPGWRAPFLLGAGTLRQQFVVVDLLGKKPEGEYTYDDLKDRIRDQLSQQLAVEHYVAQLRRTIYVSIRLNP